MRIFSQRSPKLARAKQHFAITALLDINKDLKLYFCPLSKMYQFKIDANVIYQLPCVKTMDMKTYKEIEDNIARHSISEELTRRIEV